MKRFLSILTACFFAQMAISEEVLELYIDADYSTNSAAANSIELGVRTAIKEMEGTVEGVSFHIVPMDHRGNVRRSRKTMEHFLASQSAIAFVGGLHSPPYLTHREFMNKAGVLALLPWSAAGPVTRAAPASDNWIFRLSVDDFQSSPFLVREAVEKGKCKSVALALVDTGWGRANQYSLISAMSAYGAKPSHVTLFPTTIGKAAAGTLAEDIRSSGADCVILLANSSNGSVVVNALALNEPTLRVFSHWGIVGDAVFTDRVNHEVRKKTRLQVLQTCGLKREAKGSEQLNQALRTVGQGVNQLAQIPAHSGFVHGYDLIRVFIAATQQAAQTEDWDGDIVARRLAIKQALENLERPLNGILKTYVRPFSRYSPEDPDAHEALGIEDLCLAKFTAQGYLESVQ